ncbi:hypothetical protein OPT61_g3030 [Boeremia exigua]|uniref:Uncharacterized protein n=1 Tax=Boeremia exigua TaxID=749465 RepID=A0ACC2IJB4_9PLEO|nr:hypothetical protein OPT61_g3030 [Boeremia exigua]
MMIFALSKKLQDDKGRAPKWFQRLTAMLFAAMWLSYDSVFVKMFGDGERTIGDEMDGKNAMRPYRDEESATEKDAEETGLLRDAVRVLDDLAGQENLDLERRRSLV